jgi:hypothetical protein
MRGFLAELRVPLPPPVRFRFLRPAFISTTEPPDDCIYSFMGFPVELP